MCYAVAVRFQLILMTYCSDIICLRSVDPVDIGSSANASGPCMCSMYVCMCTYVDEKKIYMYYMLRVTQKCVFLESPGLAITTQ